MSRLGLDNRSWGRIDAAGGKLPAGNGNGSPGKKGCPVNGEYVEGNMLTSCTGVWGVVGRNSGEGLDVSFSISSSFYVLFDNRAIMKSCSELEKNLSL